MIRVRLVLAAMAAMTLVGRTAAATNPAQQVLDKFVTEWGAVKTYQCTIASHEVKGTRVQDRVYTIEFSKPLDTRIDIISGDGRGSAAVWLGGERARGHRGGILAMIKLNVDIHSRIATSLRGSTIAQANFGSLLNHLRSLDPHAVGVTRDGSRTVITAKVASPAPDDDVTTETYFFGADGMPIEYFQYAADNTVLKHVVYSHLKLNVELPASTFSL